MLDESRIVYCDNHVLVVNKPAGRLVQGDRTGDETLLDDAKYYIKQRYKKPGNVYLGLVHRIDRPACGLVLFARTSKAASRLSEQIRNRTIEKQYRALVEGKTPQHAEWQDPIARNHVTAFISPDEGKIGKLSFKRLTMHDGISLVNVKLLTGRHHQIRIQFASREHPVLGDRRYGSSKPFTKGAIALQSFYLAFKHPTRDEDLSFTLSYDSTWNSYFPFNE